MSSSARPPAQIIGQARTQIARIYAWTQDMDADRLEADVRTRYAVERAFIALGEAIKDLMRQIDLLALDPDGPWREPARFRDFLAHDYDDRVIPPLLWDTITTDLSKLDAALLRIEALVGGGADTSDP